MTTTMELPRSAGTGAECNRSPARGSARCTASDILRWTGMPRDASEHSDAVLFPTRCVHARATLVHEGSRFESLYFVGAGTYKCVLAGPDGTEQVQDFATRGCVLGLEGIHEGRYGTSAVALEESMVAVVPFNTLVEAGHEVPALERMLHGLASRELARKGRTMQIMTAAGAEVRVARFLLEWSDRQAALGYSPRRIRLRMTRRDIATHLGVAHETVSRSFSQLAAWGLVKVGLRELEILDPAALRCLHSEPRGSGGHPRAPEPAGSEQYWLAEWRGARSMPIGA